MKIFGIILFEDGDIKTNLDCILIVAFMASVVPFWHWVLN